MDANGDLFGTTDPSSQNSGGVVYEIVRTSTGYESTPTHCLQFQRETRTASLGANVVADANGNLFGTTQAGGASNEGTAFEITGSGYATTPTVVPIIPNLVWQNDNGQASVWAMDGTTWIGGGLVSLNPGPTWRAVGTGTFFAGDTADLLWQNTSTGQAAVWEMDGNTRLSGGVVSLDPGPTWKAIGTGDFNGDHLSDILWQNTSTGQAAVWNMDGTTRLGGGVVSLNPGTSWKAVGTGDFYHDGHAGILWQNPGTGQVAIWDMDGNTRLGGGVVSFEPGAGLACDRIGRFLRQWPFRHPVPEREHGPGRGLGDGRDHPAGRRGGQPQSRDELARDRDRRAAVPRSCSRTPAAKPRSGRWTGPPGSAARPSPPIRDGLAYNRAELSPESRKSRSWFKLSSRDAAPGVDVGPMSRTRPPARRRSHPPCELVVLRPADPRSSQTTNPQALPFIC